MRLWIHVWIIIKKGLYMYMHQEDRIERLTHSRVNVLQSKCSFVCIQVPPQLYESYKKLYVGKAHFACTLSVYDAYWCAMHTCMAQCWHWVISVRVLDLYLCVWWIFDSYLKRLRYLQLQLCTVHMYRFSVLQLLCAKRRCPNNYARHLVSVTKKKHTQIHPFIDAFD